MNISENVKWITTPSADWKAYRNRSYKAKIQLADPDRIYNVPDKKGLVYNFLEDSYEKVSSNGFVVTGVIGEIWPVSKKAIAKYDISPECITSEPTEVDTVELDTVYAAIPIPAEIQFTLEVDYGEKAVLKGNRSGIDHGSGDYILAAARLINGKFLPDFNDSGRIVNGAIFDMLYRPLQEQ